MDTEAFGSGHMSTVRHWSRCNGTTPVPGGGTVVQRHGAVCGALRCHTANCLVVCFVRTCIVMADNMDNLNIDLIISLMETRPVLSDKTKENYTLS